MTREEAVALLERYSNYDGMGIPNLAGCKEAMKVAVDALKEAYPELAESEDERIRKRLIEYFEGFRIGNAEVKWEGLTVQEVLAYLEKQKEQKSTHFELKAGKWYICHRAFCCRADHLTVKEGERFMCEKDGVVKGFVIKEPEKYFKECSAPAPMEDEQKEPHYTKRNALFDKCVENCDPKTVEEVNKRVDDIMNMPKLSPFEQALTNFIGDWEDDEEHWPSQFVKKHGKHILDIAREELQKEQKPDDDPLDDPKFLKGFDTGREVQRIFDEQKPAEWSEEDKKMIDDIIRSLPKMAEAEDNILPEILPSVARKYAERLKSLRASWKPSEEQMEALDKAIPVCMGVVGRDEVAPLESLYEQLKKLM